MIKYSYKIIIFPSISTILREECMHDDERRDKCHHEPRDTVEQTPNGDVKMSKNASLASGKSPFWSSSEWKHS